MAVGITILIVVIVLIGLLLAKRGGFRWVWMSKGERGENQVSGILHRLLEPEYFVMDDLILNNPKGGTTQIDHLVVSKYGVFVIETKNYSGKVYGSEGNDKWTQYLRRVGYEFYNPVKQNNTHIRVLKAVLDTFHHVPYISIVAFSPYADLKVSVKNAHVVYWNQILHVVRLYSEPRISQAKAVAITKQLESVRVKEENAHLLHTQEVRRYVNQREDLIEKGICPKCGGRLVLRNGRYGSFYGCSNYPDCKFKM